MNGQPAVTAITADSVTGGDGQRAGGVDPRDDAVLVVGDIDVAGLIGRNSGGIGERRVNCGQRILREDPIGSRDCCDDAVGIYFANLVRVTI